MSEDKWIKLIERVMFYGLILAAILWLLAAMASL